MTKGGNDLSLSLGGMNFPVALIALAIVLAYLAANYRLDLWGWVFWLVVLAIAFHIVWLYLVHERTRR